MSLRAYIKEGREWREVDNGSFPVTLEQMMKALPKFPASDLARIPFPQCSRQCLAVEYLGCGECESVCPFKFAPNGEPISVTAIRENAMSSPKSSGV